MQEMTPQELTDTYPDLEKIGWKKNVLGIFLSNGLLLGTRNRNLKLSYIDPISVQKLLDFRSSIIDEQKVNIILSHNPPQND